MPLQALATRNGGKIEISTVVFGDTSETANVEVTTAKTLRDLYKIADSAKATTVQSVPAQHAASASSTKRKTRSEHTSNPVSHCSAKKPRVANSSQSDGAQQAAAPQVKNWQPVMLTNTENKAITKIFKSGRLASDFLKCSQSTTSVARNTGQVVKGWYISDPPQGVPITATTASPSGAVAVTTTTAVTAAAAKKNDVVALLDEVGDGITDRVWPILQAELVTELYVLVQLSRLDLQSLGIKLGDAVRVITAIGQRDQVPM